MRSRVVVVVAVLALAACGGGSVPVRYDPPDAAVCVLCEGEDGAQFAESTLDWAPVTCSRTCPDAG